MPEADTQGETHDEIMTATFEALSKHGYANLRMQDIADEFDKSRSLLHYHYDTKEELMLAFLDHLIGWIGDRLAESDTEEPLERLEEFVERFVVEPDEDRRDTFALALLELRLQAAHKDEFQEKLAAHYRENVATAAGIIEDGIEEGVFRETDPERTGEAIYTALVGARMYQVTLGGEGASGRMHDALAEFIVDGLLVEEYDGPDRV
jgi:AcrR family transcriptional regulator